MSKNKKINLKNILLFIIYFLVIMSYYKPNYVSYIMGTINKFFSLVKYLSIYISIILVLLNKNIRKFTIFITLSQLYILVCTYYNGGLSQYSFGILTSVFVLCTFIDYSFSHNPALFLKSMISAFLLYILVNFIYMIGNPNGLYYSNGARVWFLGGKNTTILYILPLLISLVLYSKILNKKNKPMFFIVYLLSIIQLLIGWSATSIVGLFIFSIGMVFENKLRNIKLMNVKNYFIIYIVLFFSIVVYRLQNLFSYLIMNILKKDMTFTGRTVIWDHVLYNIKQKYLLGYGLEEESIRYAKQGGIRLYSHNQLLEVLYKGGIFYASLIIIAFGTVIHQLKKYKKSKFSFVLELSILVYLIMMLTEYYHIEIFVYIFAFAYNIDNLELICGKERSDIYDKIS